MDLSNDDNDDALSVVYTPVHRRACLLATCARVYKRHPPVDFLFHFSHQQLYLICLLLKYILPLSTPNQDGFQVRTATILHTPHMSLFSLSLLRDSIAAGASLNLAGPCTCMLFRPSASTLGRTGRVGLQCVY